MNILFANADILGRPGDAFLAVRDKRISYIGPSRPSESFDRIIDCKGKLLCGGLYNAHSHSAMTIFRGLGGESNLQSWLNDYIWPAEDKLDEDRVYLGSLLASCEMIRRGVVSFSDMYFFCDATARAVNESGIKANISRCIVTFDESADLSLDGRIREAVKLYDDYNGACDGRLRVDMSLHAEYTNTMPAAKYVSEIAKEKGCAMHIHLSETAEEHEKCISRYGMTPAAFFEKAGAFDVPLSAAHCVYLSDADIEIMASHKAVAVHNPVSNLKLGSGIMPLEKMLSAGVTVALGTDGAASNNRLDVLREMQTALLLAKGTSRCASAVSAKSGWKMATENGAIAQGRHDCGTLEVDKRADIILVNTESLWNIPHLDLYDMLAYSADSSDVTMTMIDGNILYENGEFTSVDIERLKADFNEMRKHYFD